MVEYYVILGRAKRHAFKFAATSLTPHLRCWARLALSTSALAFAFVFPGWSSECGPDAAGQGVNNCGLFIPQINNGITYLNSDGVTLDLNNSTATITRAAGGGIAAIDLRDTDTGTGDLIVNATDFDRMSNFQRGIFIRKAGASGDASVTLNNGTIQTINGQTSSHGAAIYMAPTATGNASITVDGGTIITNGLNSVGLSVNNGGQGNASIVINGGQIESRSTANPGAISMVTNLTSTASSSIVMNDGDIRTGIGSAGLNSGGIIARNLGLGTAHAEIHAGTVAVRGAGLSQGGGGRDAWLSLSSGVAAVIGSAIIAPNRPQNATNTSLASALMTDGHITVGSPASGGMQYGAGLTSRNWAMGGALTTMTGGTIETYGIESSGASASTQRHVNNNSNVTTLISGASTITTNGNASAGVVAFSVGAGTARADVSGATTVTANGTNSSGITVRSRGATEVSVADAGTTVTATAINSSGIWVRQGITGATSTFDVFVGDGVVVTGGQGVDSAGIEIDSQEDNTGIVQIANGATIGVGVGARAGIWDKDGDAIVTSAGLVNGVPNGIAIDTGDGEDTVNLIALSVTNGDVDTGADDDTVNMFSATSGDLATLNGGITTGLGDDVVNILDGSVITGSPTPTGKGVNTGAGNDQVYVRSVDPSMFADISEGIATEDGDDIVRIEQNSRVTGGLNTGDGNDNVFVGTGATAVATSAVASLAGGIDTEDGDDTVRLADGSVVTGGLRTGTGDDVFNIGSSSATVHTGLASLTGGIDAGDGDDVGELRDSSVVTGDVVMSGGNDALTITSGADITGVTRIDGGGNAAFNDGEEDILHLVGDLQTRRFEGSDLTNWETVNLANNADITFHGADLVTGSDPTRIGVGHHNENAGLVVQSGSFARFDGNFTVDGDVTNRGTVDLRPDAALGTTLNVTGDYTGGSGSTLLMDVFLQDGLTDNNLSTDIGISDHLIVTGDGYGSTVVDFNNIGGPGALTDLNSNGVVDNNEGILFAQVQGGTSTANLFTLGTLSGTTIGAFTYDLVAFDPLTSASGSWDYVLANRFSEISEPYEVYPRAVMFTMPTLHQRVGNRHWDGWQPELPPEIFCKDPDQNYRCAITEEQASYYGEEKLIEENSAWVRIVGSHARIAPTVSTTGLVNYNIETVEIQAGIDRLLRESDEGNKWIGGLNAQISTAGVTGNDPNGDASMKATGLGIGGTLTYYQPNGFYTDIQARLMAVSTDFASTSGSYDNARAVVASASVEVGRKYEFGDGWRVVPQAQLTYTQARFRRFVDTVGTVVEPDNAESLKLRVGVNVGRERNWEADDGTTRRLEVEGGLNLHKELAGRTRVNVSGTPLYNEEEDTTIEVTLGATYNWNDDRNSVYGEVGVSTGLRNLGRSRRISGTIGYRRKWD